jgi:predicted NAD/FAD-binding protein
LQIAVIGSGISGLTAAHYLSRAHSVDLFDGNEYAGGHTRSICFEDEGEARMLDIGFMVYNEASYPGFTSFLKELGVPTQASDMSFSVSCASCKVEYSSRGIPGWLASRSSAEQSTVLRLAFDILRSNAVRPSMLRLGFDILRFCRDAPLSMSDPALAADTVEDYLRRRRYSDGFRRHFIVPLLAAVWSTPPALARDFPAQYFLRFIHNHGLVGKGTFRWRTVRGGSARYVEKLLPRSHVELRLGTPIRAIRRCACGVELKLGNAETRTYDKVVLACHADEALGLLKDASAEEAKALGCFPYARNRIVLHSDERFLPQNHSSWASWNYLTHDCRDSEAPLSLTYHLNRLQAIDSTTQFCVSVNPNMEVDKTRVIHETEFSHPNYTFRTLEGQRLLSRLNGERHTFFAGAYMGYGFHEDGYASGRAVAAMIGMDP